jgi:hypothetical protein
MLGFLVQKVNFACRIIPNMPFFYLGVYSVLSKFGSLMVAK